MLVLSRMAGQSLMVGLNCEIEIEMLRVMPDRIAIRTHYPATEFTPARQIVTSNLKLDTTLDVGDGILCILVQIHDDKARLGMIAPKQMEIHRKEVWAAIHPENRDDPNAGFAGSTVPRKPKPSSDSDSVRLPPPSSNA